MKLLVVTDDQMPIHKLVETLLTIEPYIDSVILREQSKKDSEVVELIQKLSVAGFEHSKIIVHGRVNLAMLTGSQNVQVPGYGLPLPLLRDHYPTLSFGRSVHAYGEAKMAADDGAAWVLYGHLYETGSKTRLPPRGTEELSKIVALLSIPVYAIGGIQPNHIDRLKTLGVSGVAVMSSIFGSSSPAVAAKSYYDAIHLKRGNFS